jgi:hypothetical protein
MLFALAFQAIFFYISVGLAAVVALGRVVLGWATDSS